MYLPFVYSPLRLNAPCTNWFKAALDFAPNNGFSCSLSLQTQKQ